MSYRIRFLLVVFSSVVVLSIGSSARAGYESYSSTATLAQSTTDFTKSLAVASFDSSKGTLVDLVISYADSGVVHGFVQNTSASNQNFTVTEDSNVALTYGTTTLLTNHLISSQSYSQLGPSQSSQFGTDTPSGSAGPMLITSGPVFNAFLAPSKSVMLTFSTLTTTTVLGGGGNIVTGIYTTAGATVTVTYDYTPFTIAPEPSSLALMAIGGVVLAATRFRKRRTR